jgi:hypothetical protein
MKAIFLFISFVAVNLAISTNVFGEIKVEKNKMEAMVLQAHEVVSVLGEEAYKSINDPEGEFVWKNAYGSKNNVGVVDCTKEVIVADFEVKGLSIIEFKDSSGKRPLEDSCKKQSLNGTWIETFWEDPARGNAVHRGVVFYITMPEKSLIIYTFGWDDNTSLDELNKR